MDWLKSGDRVFIADTEISKTGFGQVKQICRSSMTVVFEDTGAVGLYTPERNTPALVPVGK